MNVLYVDDEQPLLDIAKPFLESEGDMSVRTCSSGTEAMQLILSDDFNAVISDYQMPGMDGIDLLKAVRERRPTLPFVLFTGKGREEVAVEALHHGADSYIMKGGDAKAQFKVLANEVRMAVSRREAEESIQYNLSRFNLIMRSLSEIIFLVTEQGVISYVSPSIAGMLGYAREDVEGRHIMDLRFMDPGGTRQPGDLAGLMSSLEGEGTIFSVKAKDGSVRRLLIKSTMVMHGSDRLLIASGRDVTHLLRIEDELVIKERLLTITMDQMPIAAGIMEAHAGKMIHVNVEAARLLGYDRDEMVGKTPAELGVLGDDDRKSFLAALPPGRMVHRLEVGLRTKEGIYQKFIVSLMKISIDEGDFMFFMLRSRAGEEMPTIAELVTGMEREG